MVCGFCSRKQWIETQNNSFSEDTLRIAKEYQKTKNPDVLMILHDSIIDDGMTLIASHFNEIKTHNSRYCWVLYGFLLEKKRPVLIGTTTASSWIGVKPYKFRKLAQDHNVICKDSYINRHWKSGPRCPLWDPNDILKLEQFVSVPERRKE